MNDRHFCIVTLWSNRTALIDILLSRKLNSVSFVAGTKHKHMSILIKVANVCVCVFVLNFYYFCVLISKESVNNKEQRMLQILETNGY